MDDNTKSGGDPDQPNARTAMLPILYRRPIAVSSDKLSGKSFVRPADYTYARDAHMVPINAPQIVDAASSYPVLFTAEPPLMTVAVLGLRSGDNLFVEADGRWADGHPVPDYIRRYPFILKRNGGEQGYSLCIDGTSSMIVDGDERPFFENGQRTEMVDEVMQSCLAYQQQSDITHALVAAIAQSDILAPLDDVYTLPDGSKLKLEGFNAVDKKRLDAIPDATILEWRRNGYLDFLYLHLVSLRAWPRLFGRLRRREQGEGATD